MYLRLVLLLMGLMLRTVRLGEVSALVMELNAFLNMFILAFLIPLISYAESSKTYET